MNLENAIAWAENRWTTWSNSRGGPVEDYIWHVAVWNDGYIIISDFDLKRHPKEWKTVYNTKEKIIYDNN